MHEITSTTPLAFAPWREVLCLKTVVSTMFDIANQLFVLFILVIYYIKKIARFVSPLIFSSLLGNHLMHTQ